jgi:hypothetical protein
MVDGLGFDGELIVVAAQGKDASFFRAVVRRKAFDTRMDG